MRFLEEALRSRPRFGDDPPMIVVDTSPTTDATLGTADDTSTKNANAAVVATAAATASANPTAENITAFQSVWNDYSYSMAYIIQASPTFPGPAQLPVTGTLDAWTKTYMQRLTNPAGVGIPGLTTMAGDIHLRGGRRHIVPRFRGDDSQTAPPDMVAAKALQAAVANGTVTFMGPRNPLTLAFQQTYNVQAANTASDLLVMDGIYGRYTQSALRQYSFVGPNDPGVTQTSPGSSTSAPSGTDVQAAATALDNSDKSVAYVTAFQNAYNVAGGSPRLDVTGTLDPNTLAALGPYIPPEHLQAYFTAMGYNVDNVPTAFTGDPRHIGRIGRMGSFRRPQNRFGEDGGWTSTAALPGLGNSLGNPLGQSLGMSASGSIPLTAGMDITAASVLRGALTVGTVVPSLTRSFPLVKAFQMAWNANHPAAPPLATDGLFGPLTQAALAAYPPGSAAAAGGATPGILGTAGAAGTASLSSTATLPGPNVPGGTAGATAPKPSASPRTAPPSAAALTPVAGGMLMLMGIALGTFFGWMFSGNKAEGRHSRTTMTEPMEP